MRCGFGPRALELVELTAMGQYGEPSEAQSDSLRRLREDLELRIARIELDPPNLAACTRAASTRSRRRRRCSSSC